MCLIEEKERLNDSLLDKKISFYHKHANETIIYLSVVQNRFVRCKDDYVVTRISIALLFFSVVYF